MNYHSYYEDGKAGNEMQHIKEYDARSREQFPPGFLIPTIVCFAITAVVLIIIAVAGPFVRTNILKDPTLSSISGKNDDNGPGDGWGDNSSGKMQTYGGEPQVSVDVTDEGNFVISVNDADGSRSYEFDSYEEYQQAIDAIRQPAQ